LGTILEKLGKSVSYHTTKAVSSSLHFVPGHKKIKTTFSYSKSYDLLVFVDFTEYSRIRGLTADHQAYFDAMPLLIIDHHVGPAPKKDCIMLKDTGAISCAELIFEYAQQRWPKLIDAQVATYLYL
jgi:nanoRNase/pAp phosphatase (c-di-AMP/oligoRNAs hydrolase)